MTKVPGFHIELAVLVVSDQGLPNTVEYYPHEGDRRLYKALLYGWTIVGEMSDWMR